MKNLLMLLFLLYFQSFFAQTPVELGEVAWLRDISTAEKQAEQTGKPIFLLFQEVPGCSTCQRYGQEVLSHPLIVEAIENCFVPLAIFNNKQGTDRKVLNYFKEPSWNNPVVRIIDSKRNNLMPRLSGNYTKLGVVQSMLYVLEDAPEYLKILEKEFLAEAIGTETTSLSMYCFWSGELKLGTIEGIVATEAGFMHGREIVQVTYNPEVVKYEDLLSKAQQASCADRAFVHSDAQARQAKQILGHQQVQNKANFRLDQDRKYYLSKTHYRAVPMTPLQAIHVNRLIANSESPDAVLSDRQIAFAKRIAKQAKFEWTNRIGMDIRTAWSSMKI
ncbi:MAG: VPGUxxT family thioredoxin-like (seleno)protein, type 2 [Bacteroidota bacterium]